MEKEITTWNLMSKKLSQFMLHNQGKDLTNIEVSELMEEYAALKINKAVYIIDEKLHEYRNNSELYIETSKIRNEIQSF